jgi:hypothetical protein
VTTLLIWILLEPAINRSPAEAPVPAHFLTGNFAILGEFVERGDRDAQILGGFVDGHDFGEGLGQGLPRWDLTTNTNEL